MTFVKEKILTKKTLYILCFCFLTAVEVLSNSLISYVQVSSHLRSVNDILPGWLPGDVLIVARNCTGFAMMLIVFSGYKRNDLLTKTNIVWTVLCLAAVILLPYYKSKTMATFHTYQIQTVIFNVWWLAIAIKKLIYDFFIAKKFKIRFTAASVIWILMTLFMTISVNDTNVWPIWYFLMFAVFFLTPYMDEEKSKLWDGMIDGSIVGFLLLQGVAFLMRPYDEIRYRGMHGNSNIAGIYYLIIYVICLYKLHCLEKQGSKKGKKVFCLLIAGMALALQFMTMCRTAWIVTVLVTFIYGILVVKKLWNKSWMQTFARGIIIIVAMMIMIVPTFMAARWGSTLLPIRVWQGTEYEDGKHVYLEDEVTSEKYTELDELLSNALGRMARIFKIANASNPFVMKVYAAEEIELVEYEWLKDSALQRRVSIYKAYLEDLEWFGHTNAEGNRQMEGIKEMAWHAQNVWIQVLFFYGIFAGVLFLALTVVLFIKDYKQMMKYRENPYAIIPFFFCIIFFCFGSMEVVWYLGQLSLFLIYFTHQPLQSIYCGRGKE